MLEVFARISKVAANLIHRDLSKRLYGTGY